MKGKKKKNLSVLVRNQVKAQEISSYSPENVVFYDSTDTFCWDDSVDRDLNKYVINAVHIQTYKALLASSN